MNGFGDGEEKIRKKENIHFADMGEGFFFFLKTCSPPTPYWYEFYSDSLISFIKKKILLSLSDGTYCTTVLKDHNVMGYMTIAFL